MFILFCWTWEINEISFAQSWTQQNSVGLSFIACCPILPLSKIFLLCWEQLITDFQISSGSISSSRLSFSSSLLKVWSCYVAQADLELMILLPQPSQYGIAGMNPQYLSFFFYLFIHICIHCLGHFSLLLPAPSLSPHAISLPGRICSALISNFVEEKT
jgi:hypothetical protein